MISASEMKICGLVVAAAIAAAIPAGAAHAEANELRVSKGFGIHYMPLYIMEKLKLVEKHAAAAGLGDVKVSYRVIDGGNVINDAMLAGSLDVATGGVPGFLTLWDKSRTIPQLEVRGLSGVGGGSVWLVTRNPAVKTLADFTEKDRIAVPGIKTSFVAVVLQMAAAKRTEITAHFSSPPFSYIEADQPGFRRVVNSADIFGALTIIMSYTTKRFYEANPKLSAAFVAAVDEAAQFIAANKREAARIYIGLAQVKTSEDEMLRMLNDPETNYAAAPNGVMTYAAFMSDIGTLKLRPADWKQLFFPAVHDRPGS